MVMTSPALRYPKSLWSHNPIPRGCVLYLPLWSPHTNGLTFPSIDPFGHTCTRTASGILHFTGSATSNVNMGAIHNASAKLWVSLWFKLDSAFNSSSPADQYLFGKYLDGENTIWIRLENSTGKVRFYHLSGNVAKFDIASVATSFAEDTWHHVVASISSVAGVRLIVNGATAVTNADTTAIPNGGEFVIGSWADGDTQGIIGEIKEVVCGTDDLSGGEEAGLYAGTLPGDETEYWPMDEGSGTGAGAIKDHQPDAAADGALDSACTWENVPMHQRSKGHYFDGFDDAITVPDHNALDVSAITVMAWINVTTWATSSGIVTKRVGGATPGEWEFRLSSTVGELTWGMYNAVPTWTGGDTSDASLSTGTWYLVTFVGDGTNTIFYKNTALLTDTADATGFIVQGEDVRIGMGTVVGLDGYIGGVWIYNRALSAGEIAHIYNCTRFRYQ